MAKRKAEDKSKKVKKGKKIKIPSLSGVQSTQKPIPSGWHKAKIVSVESDSGDKGPYFKWSFEIIEGKSKGKQPKPFFTSLAANSLWNLKGLLEAIGFKIPKKGFELDPEAVVGEKCFILIDHETYEGRPQSIITMLSDERPDDDDDDDDGDDDDEDEEHEDGDLDEDADEDDDDDDEDDDDDDEDGDDEDGDELTAEEIKEMTTDELKDACEEHELKVDFKKAKTLKAQRAAVLKAAKKAGLV
jgi:hypothetical protein